MAVVAATRDVVVRSADGDAVARRRRQPANPLGVIVLLLAAVLALIDPTRTHPSTVGRAFRLPMPPPPAIGTCLLIDGAAVVHTSCDRPHNAEVARSWPAGDPPADIRSFATLIAAPFGAPVSIVPPSCLDAEYAYLDSTRTDASGDWLPVAPVVTVQLIAAPAAERTPNEGWAACILSPPDRQPYAVSVRQGFTGAQPMDSNLASCLAATATAGDYEWITCEKPHRIEVFGFFRADLSGHGIVAVPGLPPQPELIRSCAAMVATMTRFDPAQIDVLRVDAAPLIPALVPVVVDTDARGQPVYANIAKPMCFVELVGSGSLSGTLIGLGRHPLPVS